MPGWCWAPVVTDLELDTIALLGGLEDLNIGAGVALGMPRPTDLGPADGEAECRIAGGTRVTDLGLAKLGDAEETPAARSERIGDHAGRAEDAWRSLPDLQRLSLWNVRSLDDAAAPYLEALAQPDQPRSLQYVDRRCDAGAARETAQPATAVCERDEGHAAKG